MASEDLPLLTELISTPIQAHAAMARMEIKEQSQALVLPSTLLETGSFVYWWMNQAS